MLSMVKPISINARIKNNKGFTLIELMVVIAIIGILAGIGIMKYPDIKAKSQAHKDAANLRIVASAAMRYKVDTGIWPVTQVDISKDPGFMINEGNVSGWNGPYLSNWDKIFPSSYAYSYVSGTTNKEYFTNMGMWYIDDWVVGAGETKAGMQLMWFSSMTYKIAEELERIFDGRTVVIAPGLEDNTGQIRYTTKVRVGPDVAPKADGYVTLYYVFYKE